MNRDLMMTWIAKAQAAPSVHNVQPARWRVENDAILLVKDCARSLPVGDPGGNDAAISLGAAAEGLYVAAAHSGYAALEDRTDLPVLPAPLQPIARFRFVGNGSADPLAAYLETRSSWRGNFLPATAQDCTALQSLVAPDATLVTDPRQLKSLARLFDQASYGFMRHGPFRRELCHWMRLKSGHPDWARDGLNAEAMALSKVEAFGASIVMGVAFPLLDRLRIAPALLAEGKKIESCAGLILFHQPAQQDPYISGRRFHRLWLEMEALGMGAAVLAALADDTRVAAELARDFAIPTDHKLVSAFRIGRRDGVPPARARLSLDDVLV